jgi:fumarate hydratase class I
MKFLEDNIKTIGTSACPPYHLAIVIGGLSAEMTLKTVKLASARYLGTIIILRWSAYLRKQLRNRIP